MSKIKELISKVSEYNCIEFEEVENEHLLNFKIKEKIYV